MRCMAQNQTGTLKPSKYVLSNILDDALAVALPASPMPTLEMYFPEMWES